MINIEWINGPHSQFILIAYGLSAVIIVYCAMVPILRRRALLKHIRLQRRAENLSGQKQH